MTKNVTQAYIDKEEADQRKPVELYHIWRDGGEHWRYTDGDVAVTFDGNIYSPASLSRASTQYNAELEISTLEVTAAYVEDPVLEFIAINPIEILWISITKLHRDQVPLEGSIIFLGQIKDVSFKGISAQINCVGFEHFLKQTVPRWRYIVTCNHTLFDSWCSLLKADYEVNATPTLDADGVTLTDAIFATFDDGYFIRGDVVFGLESRAIVDHVGSIITMAYRMSELKSEDPVVVYPGCDGRLETCKNTFSNTEHFLGFPYIPVDNPAQRIP